MSYNFISIAGFFLLIDLLETDLIMCQIFFLYFTENFLSVFHRKQSMLILQENSKPFFILSAKISCNQSFWIQWHRLSLIKVYELIVTIHSATTCSWPFLLCLKSYYLFKTGLVVSVFFYILIISMHDIKGMPSGTIHLIGNH